MMKKIIFLLVSMVLFSCERKEPNFSEEMIEKLAYMHEDPKLGLLPSKYYGYDLYVWTDNNKIYKTDNHELFFYYKKEYSVKFESFQKFLDAVLNQDFLLQRNLFKDPNGMDSLKLNQKIEKECAGVGFDKFLEKYSKVSSRKGELELNKSNLKNDEYLTIAYFLYINRYDISQDCYHGVDYIYKREDYFKF